MIRKALVSLAAMAALSPAAHAASGWGLLNMTQGVTAISREIYKLHMLIFWVCVIIGVVVFGVMIYSLLKFRKSQGAVADTTMVHNTKVEVVWTVIPVVILVAMAVPAANTLVQLEDTRNTELTIKVTGYQWGWQYDYLDKGVVFFSRLTREADAARRLASGADVNKIPNYLRDVDNPLIVPVDTKVRLLVTTIDVIHA
jgi:cytochrome c oxidase subunit 2